MIYERNYPRIPRGSAKSICLETTPEETNYDITISENNGGVEEGITFSMPKERDLLNALVGYEHDPLTHNYNRAERRRIIRAAQKLMKKQNEK